MDEIKFTKHTVLLDLRELYKTIPSVYHFKPRANPSATIAIIHDIILDCVIGNGISNNINTVPKQAHSGRAAFGRLSAMGFNSGVSNAIVGRVRDIFLSNADLIGLRRQVTDPRMSPYNNLGWYVDGVCTKEPHILKISFPRVIINGKQHSMEYYRDDYLFKSLKADVKKRTSGFYGVGMLHRLKTSTLMLPREKIIDEIVRGHEAATSC